MVGVEPLARGGRGLRMDGTSEHRRGRTRRHLPRSIFSAVRAMRGVVRGEWAVGHAVGRVSESCSFEGRLLLMKRSIFPQSRSLRALTATGLAAAIVLSL